MKLLCSAEDPVGPAAYRSYFETVTVIDAETDFYLSYLDGILKLCRSVDPRGIWISPGDVRKRVQGDFLLGRACGIRRGTPLEVMDATAGLGMDGLALGLTGQRVTLVERHPVLWALLCDLIDRMPDVDTRALRLDDCARVLESSGDEFDVIYFDPMFPVRGKSALPGKRMQYVSELLGPAQAFDFTLIDVARSRARGRVVLKRRLKDPVFGRPDWSIRGRSIRYDVYRGIG